MRKIAILSAFALIVGIPAIASAALHPDAYANGTGALGNTVYCVTSGSTGTEFCLNNGDGPGVGFNDTTAAAPIGGNGGVTVGEQRINAYMESFRLWADTVTSGETIWVQGTFGPLSCTATGGVLGAAGTIQIFAEFGGAAWPTTWYHSALANRLAGTDLGPGGPDPGILLPPFADDIVSFFNGDLGNPGCLTGLTWYYGYDGLETASQIDFLQVLTHEVGHGMGHANFIDEDGDPSGCFSTGTCAAPPGSGPLGWPDIYTVFSRENSLGGRHWNQMHDGQRAASATSGSLAWDGPNTNAAASGYLFSPAIVRAGAPLSADFEAFAASYTPYPPDDASITAPVWPWVDDVDSSGDPGDACYLTVDTSSAFCGAPPGTIHLINRGACSFAEKTAVSEFLCGAAGVILTNVTTEVPFSPGGTALIPAVFPTVMISGSDGDAFKAEAPGSVTATIRQDSTLGLVGADDMDNPFLYAPFPVAPGSSVSHWDTSLSPNALMEPFINADLDVGTTMDLTPPQMMDIGWDGSIHCPVDSDDSATVVIDGCDTGVSNDFGPWTLIGNPKGKGWKTTSGTVMSGCYITDMINGCAAGVATHGDFKSCADNVANSLRKAGAISPSDSDAIKACADTAAIP